MLNKHQLLEAIAGTGSNLPVYVRGPNSPEEFPCRVTVEGLQGGTARIILTSEGVGGTTATDLSLAQVQPGDQSNFALDGGRSVDGTEDANVPAKTVDSLATGEKVVGDQVVDTGVSEHDTLARGVAGGNPSATQVGTSDNSATTDAESAAHAEAVGNAESEAEDSDGDGIPDDEDPDDYSDLDAKDAKSE
jgi:hypothetical protein